MSEWEQWTQMFVCKNIIWKWTNQEEIGDDCAWELRPVFFSPLLSSIRKLNNRNLLPLLNPSNFHRSFEFTNSVPVYCFGQQREWSNQRNIISRKQILPSKSIGSDEAAAAICLSAAAAPCLIGGGVITPKLLPGLPKTKVNGIWCNIPWGGECG